MSARTSGGLLLPSPQEVLAWAEFYAFNMGWVIMPIHQWTGLYNERGGLVCSCELTGRRWPNCNPEKPGKHPWVGWKQTPMETPEQGYAAWRGVYDQYWGRNGVAIGIRTGAVSGFFAIDLDVGGLKNGVADFEAWMKKAGLTWNELGTLSALTGGGGFHLLYQYPSTVEKISTLTGHKDIGPAVDIKGDGGYILVAPSLHHKGNCYQWRSEIAKSAVRPAPKELVIAVEKKKQSFLAVDVGAYTPSLEELKDYADELSRKKGTRSRDVGKNMLAALTGDAIAEEGGAHDAYRDIMFFVAKQWPTCDPVEILNYFQESVAARFQNKSDASTNMENLLDSMVTALRKSTEAAGQWTGRVALAENGKPLATDANMVLFFENHPAWKDVLGYNLRTNRPVYLRKPPIELETDGTFNLTRDKSWISLWLQNRAQMAGRITHGDVQSALVAVSNKHGFDPLQQLILQLRGFWDGVPRLETIFQRIAGTPDGDWPRTVAPLWFKSLVARVLYPGCQCDTMLILEGHQGFRKSSFFRGLLPSPEYFSDSLNRVHLDVESIRLLHSGPAIFELGELSGLRKQEVEEIKAFLSACHDDLRPLYEGYRKTPRRCIFVGTTNRDDYLRDETGGRRFWPIRVLKPIDLELVAAERVQWFAEALYRVEAGERWYLNGRDEGSLAVVEQNARFEEDIWFGAVAIYLAPENKSSPLPPAINGTQQMVEMLNKRKAGDFITTMQVAENALKLELKNARSAEGIRINRIVRKLGWQSAREYVEGVQMRGWRRPEQDI